MHFFPHFPPWKRYFYHLLCQCRVNLGFQDYLSSMFPLLMFPGEQCIHLALHYFQCILLPAVRYMWKRTTMEIIPTGFLRNGLKFLCENHFKQFVKGICDKGTKREAFWLLRPLTPPWPRRSSSEVYFIHWFVALCWRNDSRTTSPHRPQDLSSKLKQKNQILQKICVSAFFRNLLIFVLTQNCYVEIIICKKFNLKHMQNRCIIISGLWLWTPLYIYPESARPAIIAQLSPRRTVSTSLNTGNVSKSPSVWVFGWSFASTAVWLK